MQVLDAIKKKNKLKPVSNANSSFQSKWVKIALTNNRSINVFDFSNNCQRNVLGDPRNDSCYDFEAFKISVFGKQGGETSSKSSYFASQSSELTLPNLVRV